MSERRLLPIIYCYSGAQWVDYPGRQFALMRAMASETDVYFLNEPVLRGDLVEFKQPRVEVIFEGLNVIHDAFLFCNSRVGKRLGRVGAMPDSLAFHQLLRRLGVEEYIFWIASPRRSLLWGIQTQNLVYDCIDPSPDDDLHHSLHQTEQWFARHSRAVFCTAEDLQERLLPENPNCFLVPNAASAPDFAENVPRVTPEALRSLKRPIAGFMGTLDFRLDYVLLAKAARRLPQVTFVIAGFIAAKEREDLQALAALPNVFMPGSTNDDFGRDYIAAFDVGLIPFNPGLMGDGINPVKMYMYLAAGKPVVSTWMRECRRLAPLVAATANADEFVAAIENELQTDSFTKRTARIEFARQNTWQARAKKAAGHLRELGLVTKKPAVSSGGTFRKAPIRTNKKSGFAQTEK